MVLSFQASAASSLPVERAFAETKRSEAPRLCHVATASRNLMLRQHLRQRQELLEAAEASAALLRRSLKARAHTLAWEARPGLAASALQGDYGPTRAFINQHQLALQTELERRRVLARAAVDRTRTHDLPVTEQSWIAWFREHEDDFQAKMTSAGESRRRKNRRLLAAPDIPDPERRIGVRAPKLKVAKLLEWQQLCWGRTGWCCLQTQRGVKVLF